MNMIPTKEKQLLDCLTAAVSEVLDRKRRLGQYAVVWRDGKPAVIGDDAPESLSVKSNATGPTTSSGPTAFEDSGNQSSST